MRNKIAWLCGLALVISGVLTGLVMYLALNNSSIPVVAAGDGVGGALGWIEAYFAPGLFFGLAIALIAYLRSHKRTLPLLGVWMCASLFAWVAAFRIFVSGVNLSLNASTSGVVPAGLVGAAILAVMYRVLVRKVAYWRMILATLLGGLLAYVMTLVPGGNSLLVNLTLSFVVWQLGVGLALAL